MLSFVDQARQDVINFYAKNDTAHQIDHADEVFRQAVAMNIGLSLGVSYNLIAAAAYYHDIFASDRDTHHTKGYWFVKLNNTPSLAQLNEEERCMVAAAIREHRASYKGQYTSKLSELISAADRGCPASIEDRLERSVKYAMSKLKQTEEEAREHARIHIREKYGTNGYARYPDIYAEYYGEALKNLQATADAL